MKRSGIKKLTLEEVREKQAKKRELMKTKPQNALGRKKVRKATKLGGATKNKTYPYRLKRSNKKKSPLSKLKKELWQLCREITIKRDGSDCYTCPSKALEGSNRQLGHFISSSICSTELRYDLRNLRIQCYSCNINKSGNWLAFENRLKQENGEDYVAFLKAENERTKGLSYRADWYTSKITQYKAILEGV